MYLVALAAGFLLELAAPLPFFHRVASSVAKFRAAGTPVPARKPTRAIVRTGPYRFSRNPIYLAFSLFQLGVAMWLDSLWLAAVAVMQGVIQGIRAPLDMS